MKSSHSHIAVNSRSNQSHIAHQQAAHTWHLNYSTTSTGHRTRIKISEIKLMLLQHKKIRHLGNWPLSSHPRNNKPRCLIGHCSRRMSSANRRVSMLMIASDNKEVSSEVEGMPWSTGGPKFNFSLWKKLWSTFMDLPLRLRQ